MNKETKTSILLKSGVVVFTLIGVANSVIRSLIAGDGFRSLFYFTLQSNIFNMVVIAVFLIDAIMRHRGNKTIVTPTLRVLKYVSLTSVTLTFFVFGLILAPAISFIYVISVTSITLHFIAPLLTLADFWLFDRGKASSKNELWYAFLPPLAYFVFVMVATLVGIRFPAENTFVPYFFLDYQTLGWFRIDANGIGVAYWSLMIFIFVGAIAYLLWKVKQPKTNHMNQSQEASHD